MTAHAKFGASNAKRRINCPGSLNAEAPFPNESSPYAELGTAAHELGETCLLNGHEDASIFMGQEFNGHKVDDNMARAVQVYIDYIRDVAASEPSICRYEKRFSLDKLDPPMPMFGTADCIIYGKESGTLYVIDYKHGQGVAVEVADNEQLKYYALGGILEIGEKAPVNKVVTVVVQPRAMHPDGPVREYSYSRDDIMDFGTELIDAAYASLKPDAPRISGDHCKFCLAAGTCSALRNNALEIAQDEFGTVRTVNDLTPQEVADYLQRVPLIEEWIKSLRRHPTRRSRCSHTLALRTARSIRTAPLSPHRHCKTLLSRTTALSYAYLEAIRCSACLQSHSFRYPTAMCSLVAHSQACVARAGSPTSHLRR